MRMWIAALVGALLIGFGPVAAQERNPAIEGVIQSQIDAFLRDDFETAFTFAAPGIRQMFQTPERFGVMVRRGYPMVWRPADVRFLGVESVGGAQMQKVMITDQAGGVHVLGYAMIQGPDGWQIAGVQILPAPDVGA